MGLKGFFNIQPKRPPRSSPRTRTARSISYTCETCGLHKNVRNPKIEPYGEYNSPIMNIGEAPGKQEDRRGKPWQGPVGQYLQDTLKRLGVNIFDDCININSVNCFPANLKTGNTRAPTAFELSCCREVKVLPAITKYKPKVIILYGSNALQSVIGSVWGKGVGSITRWRGICIPDQKLNAWICPVFHPSYLLRLNDPGITGLWRKDLKRALSLRDVEVPETPLPEIEYHTDINTVGEKVKQFVGNHKLIAFDYETTGVKPHARGHRIVCASIATSGTRVLSFLLPSDPNSPALQGLKDILGDRTIKKMAHNMKFEESWSAVWLGRKVLGWRWDSMIAAHLIDPRTSFTGLKFQAYVNFGVADWSPDFAEFKKSKTTNSKNNIEEIMRRPGGEEAVLKYCAMDSALQFALFMKQRKKVNMEAYKLFHRGVLALQRAGEQGIHIDIEYCQDVKDKLTKRVERAEQKLKESYLGKEWLRHLGKINFASGTQLGKVLYDHLKLNPATFTKTGKGSTDTKQLEAFLDELPELKYLISIRKNRKIMDTYLEGFVREEVNGIIHPDYNLHTVKTYRSSSSNPNFQNIPKREKKVMEICRGAIFPRKGNKFVEVDYSGIEVRIACCITKDKKLIEDTVIGDMHRDMAIELYKLDTFDKADPGDALLRQGAKNGFVFPQFYGDYYGNNVPILLDWAKDVKLKNGLTAYEHLERKRLIVLRGDNEILDCRSFENHVKKVEDAFWNERYHAYTKWKDETWKNFQSKGYIDTPTGFRIKGVLSRNELLNAPIQGAAFHCLLWSFVEIDKLMRKNKWDTKLVGQVHDSILFDVNPDEWETIKKEVQNTMTTRLREAWDWIILPLEIEMEEYSVDGSWV